MMITLAATTLIFPQSLPIGDMRRAGLTTKATTAVLIGPCHALTARHLISNPRIVGREVIFRHGTLVSKGQIVLAGKGMSLERSDFSGDWALAYLPSCPGHVLGFVPLGTAIGRSDLTVGVWNHWLMYPQTHHCQITYFRREQFQTDCSVKQGDSGGAVVGIDWLSKKPVLFGLVSAGTRGIPTRMIANPIALLAGQERRLLEAELRRSENLLRPNSSANTIGQQSDSRGVQNNGL
jgi:V8-like Glu-specific endopeptidase